jgi:hypothetical protein
MSAAWDSLAGNTGDAWERMCGMIGDAWDRLPGRKGDAWRRLLQRCGIYALFNPTSLQGVNLTAHLNDAPILDPWANDDIQFSPIARQSVILRVDTRPEAVVKTVTVDAPTLVSEAEPQPVVKTVAVDAPDLVSKGGP